MSKLTSAIAGFGDDGHDGGADGDADSQGDNTLFETQDIWIP